MSPPKIYGEIYEERQRQIDKFGDQSHLSHPLWLAILAEEFGEVAREIVEDEVIDAGQDLQALRKELVQLVTVGVAWIEKIDE